MKISAIIPFLFAFNAHASSEGCILPLTFDALQQEMAELQSGVTQLEKNVVDRLEFIDMMKGTVFMADGPRFRATRARLEALALEVKNLVTAGAQLDAFRAHNAIAEFADIQLQLPGAMIVEYVPDQAYPTGKRSREAMGRLGDEFGDDLKY